MQAERAQYPGRLVAELAGAHERLRQGGAVLPSAVDSVYFGGGTPSIFSADEFALIFAALRENFDLLDGAEITVEVAPGTLSNSTLDALLRAGCNRISLGVQSFVEQEAAWVGRRHTQQSIFDEIARLRHAGIHNLTVDLIAGLPGQSFDSWQLSIDALLQSGVPHASLYMFEIDEDSRLGRELLEGGHRYHAELVPDEELVSVMYHSAIEQLAAAGLMQYEISNFARPGSESRHNLRYWQRKPYLGVGLDASSMLRGAAGTEREGQVLRLSTTDRMPDYLAGAEPVEAEWLDQNRQHEEAWFLGLRTNAGVDLAALEAEFGTARVNAARTRLPSLVAAEWIVCDGEKVRLTAKGRLLANEVFEEFLDLE